MPHPIDRADARRSFALTLGLLLAVPSLLGAESAGAEPYAAGDTIEPFTLEDQHGESHSIDASVRLILFSRDMDGGDLLKQALADAAPEALTMHGAVYVADISGMPGLVARMFAIPAMRKRPYALLLDRDGETTARLPDVEDKATLIILDALTIQRIEHVPDSAAVLRELEGTPANE